MKSGRRTVAVATLVGALGLSVLNAPAAQAADTGITVSDIVINKGRPIVVGTTKEVAAPISFNIALPAGQSTANPSGYTAHPFIYRGDRSKAVDTGDGYIGPGIYTCFEIDAKHARCEGEFHVDPHPSRRQVNTNAAATAWKVAVVMRLWKASGGLKTEEYETRSTTVQLKRAARATVAATPETVTKGRKVTVTGKLTRANWSTKKYGGYSGRTVSLQYRASDATSFKTVKKVTTSSTGGLNTTVTASADGFYRWVYYGNSTTDAVTTSAVYVDVR
ncbi:hypothetical protein [Streptomyces stelliscabiei]|uniref:hypothetical protein n=1 Tax=Streptomyces stelliscabiei TaxID=146820 RepID=UPI0029A43BE3|nr:hypothetical protein [Streptomyces stelliscabiei]MDX2554020.1 hypothetical protein [Streptomyces stelliscabiei]MDX2612763.1 hypothetical protein [Streptomyces stelliscabiei]MDX2638193.1 hypothetical protein [Streptomyces stelliscabiei]MDX2666053.1 hypothetical protein [Streptomyces stelliscabiei]MDX2716662.1 hypothetical protein [Streptomyces stelliscabiei]